MNQFTGALDICVLIPCYNNLPGLLQSLASIVYHPGKLLVLIVDDGSTVPVKSDEIAQALAPGLLLQVLTQPENSGITAALNRGLEWIRDNLTVKYISRLDCSDLCHPERFYQQFALMEAEPRLGLTGTWCRFQDPKSGLAYNYTTPLTHAEIVSEMHFRNVFIHPTVMFRTRLVDEIGLYPENYGHAEDYAFFMKMLRQTKTAIIGKILITCEINPGGISMRNRRAQLKARKRVVADLGSRPLLKMAGLIRLQFLGLIPYRFILWLKEHT